MSTKTKFTAFGIDGERSTLKANRPKTEDVTFGQAVGEFLLAIILVGALFLIGNLVLGLD